MHLLVAPLMTVSHATCGCLRTAILVDSWIKNMDTALRSCAASAVLTSNVVRPSAALPTHMVQLPAHLLVLQNKERCLACLQKILAHVNAGTRQERCRRRCAQFCRSQALWTARRELQGRWEWCWRERPSTPNQVAKWQTLASWRDHRALSSPSMTPRCALLFCFRFCSSVRPMTGTCAVQTSSLTGQEGSW